MTRKQVEQMGERLKQMFFIEDCKVFLSHDAAQRETIRRLEADVQTLNELLRRQGLGQGEIDSLANDFQDLQARLTASETKHKWTTERPTVAGFYWFRKGGKKRVVELEFESDGETLAAEGWRLIANYWNGEFQGPLTPGEE